MGAAELLPTRTRARAASSRATLALAAGEKAAGARFVRRGFARSPEMDLAFALGFPHLRWVTDDDGGGEDPQAAAQTAVDAYQPDARLVWPRASAVALVRLVANGGEVDGKWSGADTPGADEARAMMAERMDFGAVPDRFTSVLSVQLLEALAGTRAVVDGLVEGLARRAARKPRGDRWWGEVTAWELGYLLLRLPEAESHAARARLRELLCAMRARTPADDMVHVLDVVLHGRVGAERSGYREVAGGAISPFFVGHVPDDAAFVAHHATHGVPDVSSWPDARLAFLGGERVVEHVRRCWTQYRGHGVHGYLVATFGEIAGDGVRLMIEDMARRSSAKREAAEWLAARAGISGMTRAGRG